MILPAKGISQFEILQTPKVMNAKAAYHEQRIRRFPCCVQLECAWRCQTRSDACKVGEEGFRDGF
jgi:hypothetical protein